VKETLAADVKPLSSVNAAFLAGDPRRAHALLGSSRTVKPNKNVNLQIDSYTARCSGDGSYNPHSALQNNQRLKPPLVLQNPPVLER
jgi:hypothetical protein